MAEGISLRHVGEMNAGRTEREEGSCGATRPKSWRVTGGERGREGSKFARGAKA